MEEKNLVDKSSEDQVSSIKGERKQITVAFSDLSSYTAISNKLDAEDVKEVMTNIFEKAEKVISKYDGKVDKYIGDAVMYLFGYPNSHEDDPVRTIKAAMEIHEAVDEMSHDFEKKTGFPLSLHTGIDTGTIVTDPFEFHQNKESILGDSINLASRLTHLAKPGEILVGKETRKLSSRHFNFDEMESEPVESFDDGIISYKLASAKEISTTIHRVSGLRSSLIGRNNELSILKDAAKRLEDGIGSVFSIIGEAGTGKSRLVEEFKNSIDLGKFQWREGRAFSFSNNISYFLLIDLLSKAWKIREDDSKEAVKEKLEKSLERLLGGIDVAPFIGGLYSLDYEELVDINPEHWKIKLLDSIKEVLRALTDRAPTIIYLEDLHWADPTSIETLSTILTSENYPVIFLLTYRPTFSFPDSSQREILGEKYREIELNDLSRDETQYMIASLLDSSSIPNDLSEFVKGRVEGNPFYVEEFINSLIETDILMKANGSWKLIKTLDKVKIPTTINGVISSRLDMLEKETRRVLQEASVIGRSFLFEVLHKISDLEEKIEESLSGLEDLDLIRTLQLKPDLEYIFKHALTQDVAYSRLLIKERKILHEKIAIVMEELFHNRLEEFFEILAYHYQNGQSEDKAIEYLVKSGEKNLKKYSLEESHQYFKQAYQILESKNNKSESENELQIDILIEWALVFLYRGAFREFVTLFSDNMEIARLINDKAKRGMFYVWLGSALFHREKFKAAYDYLCQGIALGEEAGDQRVVGYGSTWASQCSLELGFTDRAIVYAKKARNISTSIEKDHFLRYLALESLGYTYAARGQRMKTGETGETLLKFSQEHPNNRAQATGHWLIGFGYIVDGNYYAAISSLKMALQASRDPWVSQYPNLHLGLAYVYANRFSEAKQPLKGVASFCKKFGGDLLGKPAEALLAVISISEGDLSKGMKELEAIQKVWVENDARWRHTVSESVLGNIYMSMIDGSSSIGFRSAIKNLFFLIKTIPVAAKKAETHFQVTIKNAKEIGDKGTLGEAYLGLGKLYKLKKKPEQAKEYLDLSVQCFRSLGVETYRRQAEEMLEMLETSPK